MANAEHLKVVEQGAVAIDAWRERHPRTRLNLMGANLSRANLSRANLSRTNLNWADLNWANLSGADLSGAVLIEAILSGADFSGAVLSEAVLRRADFSGAVLSEAILSRADLSGTNLSGANLSGALCTSTAFANLDLRDVKGLEAIKHIGPSTIGIDTIFKSKGRIPEVFLRGCGVPEEWIGYIQGMAKQPIQFYQCVISHSAQDELFCTRLYNDLQANGVRCWYFPRDARGGRGLEDEIDQAIRIYDKVMVVCSAHSLASEPVQKEIRKGWDKERQTGKKVLFPLAIDDFVYKSDDQYATLLRATVIEDFRQWATPAEYKKSLDKLVKDLAKDEPAPPSAV